MQQVKKRMQAIFIKLWIYKYTYSKITLRHGHKNHLEKLGRFENKLKRPDSHLTKLSVSFVEMIES